MRIRSNKNDSLDDLQKAIDNKVETFMGGPPGERPEPGGVVEIPEPEEKKLPTAPLVDSQPPKNPKPTSPQISKFAPTETQPSGDIQISPVEKEETPLAQEEQPPKDVEPKHTGGSEKLKKFIKNLWANPKERWALIIAFVVLILGLVTLPSSRYFLLNTAGIRSSSSLTVLDGSTQLPLKNASVTIANQTAVTDGEGQVRLKRLKLGPASLTIQKKAFADVNQKLVVGWGSNPLGSFSLKAVGVQYKFVVVDWLSNKPLVKAEASSGDGDAQSDDKGLITLTIDAGSDQNLPVKIKAENYREETMPLPNSTKDEHTVKLVPSRKSTYVSKRSGNYDVYKVDVDGKNEELLLKATGYERDDLALVAQPNSDEAALVSTRDNVHDTEGYLLSSLILINVSNKTTVSLGQSERIQIIGWVGNRIVYAQVMAGASAANPKRYRLISYDYKTTDKRELASGNAFNDVLIAADNIYFAPSSYLQNQPDNNLYKINGDGTSRQSILDKEVWNIFRANYDVFNLLSGKDWYDFKLGDKSANQLKTEPSNVQNRLYIDSADKKHSLWSEERDGKGTLLVYNLATKTDKVIHSQAGLRYPLRWLNNNTVIYRVQIPSETADYVINIEGGEAKKIRDVAPTAGLTKWYYY